MFHECQFDTERTVACLRSYRPAEGAAVFDALKSQLLVAIIF